MQIKQAKKIVNTLSNRWKLSLPLNLDMVLDRLWSGTVQEYSSFNTFEFSLVSSEKRLRLLHLNFHQADASCETIKMLRKKRMESIIDIIKYANRRLRGGYNFRILRSIFSLINHTLWPVQFGCEVSNGAPAVIKVYFSIINNNDYCGRLLGEMCSLLGLEWQKFKGDFAGKNFDVIGVDLLSNGHCRLKIYTFYQSPFGLPDIKKIYRKYQNGKDRSIDSYFSWMREIPIRHIGFLYRLSEKSDIDSVKIWTRFDKAIPPDLLTSAVRLNSERFKNRLDSSVNIIKSVGGNISYLTLENSKLGVYFR